MITIESLRSYQDTPVSLRLICLKKIITEPVNLCRYVLPPELGDLIAVAFRDHALVNRLSEDDCHNFFKHFKHKYLPLTRIDFSGLPISERFFTKFLYEYQNQLNEVNISRCTNLLSMGLKILNILKENQDNQKTLIIGETLALKFDKKNGTPKENIFDDNLKVKKLVVHKLCPRFTVDEFTINRNISELLPKTMSVTLKYLDLSHCNLGKGTALMHLESLEILILYNCRMYYQNIICVCCHLKKLRVLDLSRQVNDNEDSENLVEEYPNLLDLLVTRLPNLTSLDISGTTLIGIKDRNISAFEKRMDKPFEFLGLFHTNNDAAYRSCIPAITIAGEANETQILNACEAFMDKPEQLAKALNDLYNLYKTTTPSETFDNVSRALDVVLPILTRHISDEQVIIFTTAALWCIVKINVTSKNLNDAKVRRTITSRLLDVMHYHKSSRVILINGGLTLLFLPDIICEHSRVAAISLIMCRDTDARTQGFGTTLLNTLACQVGGDQKIFIGELNAIETMIDIINAKIEDNTCDEILETAWSTLWNITDETAVNCQKFLNCRGLEAFVNCMDKFANNKEVLRNIMGLLGNVAECKLLRDNFMEQQYIQRFVRLLLSPIDGIECSYNACGILAHLISEGAEYWNCHPSKSISRDSVMHEMRTAISQWPINSRRNINYRSFSPIVRLLERDVAPAAQYWAVFALTNLTRINPSKYCPMLLPNDGLARLYYLASPDTTEPCVSNLAAIAVYQYERFEAEQTLAGLEQCDSTDLEVVKNFRAESTGGDGTSEMGELLL